MRTPDHRNLNDNQLTGQLPSSLSSLAGLANGNFHLGDNAFNGLVPAKLCAKFGLYGAWYGTSCSLGGPAMGFTCPVPVPDCAGTMAEQCSYQCFDAVSCVGEWTTWVCAQSCAAAGTASRTFGVDTPAAYGGDACVATDGFVQSGSTCNSQPCPVSCVGEWTTWACPQSCGAVGNRTRTFEVFTSAASGGTACLATNGLVRSGSPCNSEPCPAGGDGNNTGVDTVSTGPTWVLPAVASGLGAAVLAIIAVVVFYTHRKRTIRHVYDDSIANHHQYHKAVVVNLAQQFGDDPATIMLEIGNLLDAGCTNWIAVQKLAHLVNAYRLAAQTTTGAELAFLAAKRRIKSSSSNNNNGDLEKRSLLSSSAPGGGGCGGGDGSSGDLDAVNDDFVASTDHPRLNRADAILRASLAEYKLLFDSAFAFQNLADAVLYEERVKLLAAALSESGGAATAEDATLECVVPGLLLHKDRFSGTSEAFLGRGASGVVSRGVMVEIVGSGEVRLKQQRPASPHITAAAKHLSTPMAAVCWAALCVWRWRLGSGKRNEERGSRKT